MIRKIARKSSFSYINFLLIQMKREIVIGVHIDVHLPVLISGTPIFGGQQMYLFE